MVMRIRAVVRKLRVRRAGDCTGFRAAGWFFKLKVVVPPKLRYSDRKWKDLHLSVGYAVSSGRPETWNIQKDNDMNSARIKRLLLVPALLAAASCAAPPVSKTPTPEIWSTPVFNRLLAVIDRAEVSPFDSIREILEERIARAPVFPPATEKIRSDELFLLSPRNTTIRPSAWDRTFTWNWAEGGRDYILHGYSKDNEVFRRMMGNARRAVVSEHDAPFVPGVVYSWDVSLCVDRCNLHLSSRAALRPTFVILSSAEEAAVDDELKAVTAWCEGAGIARSEEGAAIFALTLETESLYMEEAQFLQKELKERPGSVLLHLIHSGAFSAMNSPYGARDEYEKARAIYEKGTGGAAGDIPPGGPAGHE
jgi:hypothetical protein